MIKKIPKETDCFTFYNANPKNKRTCDCVIRAISTITEKSWEETLLNITQFAIKYCQMVNDPKLYEKYLQSLGFVKHSQPRKYDNTKYTGTEFCKTFRPKACVAHIGGNHIVAIKDGKIYDIWNSENGCIGNYWSK